MNKQIEQEEEDLAALLSSGEITLEEYNREIDKLYRSYRTAAEESAQAAYDEEINRW
jgi:hypothetical protein